MLCVISFDPFCSSLGTNRGAKNDLFVRKVDLPSSFSLMIWTIEILR
ncbi:unnamed protein product, partial [Musa acuminata var. zebrina]